MLSDGARDAVAKARGTRRLVLVATVDGTAADKDGLLQTLARHGPSGLRVTAALAGTPNLVVSAPGAFWKAALGDAGSWVHAPGFELAPNSLDWSVP